MHTFARKSKPTQQIPSFNTTLARRARFGLSYQGNSNPHIQRSIGNQAGQSLPEGYPCEISDTALRGNSRFVHDFSQLPVHSATRLASSPVIDQIRTNHSLNQLTSDDASIVEEERLQNAPQSSGSGAASGPTACCVHPVNPRSTQIARNLDFGLKMRVNWASPTGNLSDLSACHITENITYSRIVNPPFGPANGATLPESGTTQRIPAGAGIPATRGRAIDTHRHPRSLVNTGGLPTAQSGQYTYTVTQTYDYNCPACGGGWTPFAYYTITYKIYGTAPNWRFSTHKIGTDGPFTSDEAI